MSTSEGPTNFQRARGTRHDSRRAAVIEGFSQPSENIQVVLGRQLTEKEEALITTARSQAIELADGDAEAGNTIGAVHAQLRRARVAGASEEDAILAGNLAAEVYVTIDPWVTRQATNDRAKGASQDDGMQL